MTARDPAFDRLLARYWDGSLTPAEWAHLNARLESDPDARRWFREVCIQAVAAGEVGQPADAPAPAATAPPAGKFRVSRRAALGFGVGGAAGLVVGTLFSRWLPAPAPTEQAGGVTLTWTRGQVVRTGPNGTPLEAGGVVPSGGGLSTLGSLSSAVLEMPDGSTVCLSADTTVAVSDGGNKLVVNQGGATADLRPQADGQPEVSVGTPLVGLSAAGGAGIDLCSGGRQTEVTVQRGWAAASHPAGVTDLRDGELLSVGLDTGSTVRPTPVLPDNYALDFTQRLPEGWKVGLREETPYGPVLAPELWYDPYHSAKLYQIRSHQSWVRGLVRLFPDSVVHLRYRVDRPADGQVVLVCRRPRSTFKDSGCLVWDGRFEGCRPGEWKPLTLRAADLLDNKEGPRFAPPWVAFLLIFNTYAEDAGLRVAEFRVSRPG